jgi:hypothetical protein
MTMKFLNEQLLSAKWKKDFERFRIVMYAPVFVTNNGFFGKARKSMTQLESPVTGPHRSRSLHALLNIIQFLS